MRLANAFARSYKFARREWLFPQYHAASVIVLFCLAAGFLLGVPRTALGPEVGFWVWAALMFWFANWARRKQVGRASQPAEA